MADIIEQRKAMKALIDAIVMNGETNDNGEEIVRINDIRNELQRLKKVM
jgi:hypothetical protein